jgi:hypothetical protein
MNKNILPSAGSSSQLFVAFQQQQKELLWNDVNNKKAFLLLVKVIARKVLLDVWFSHILLDDLKYNNNLQLNYGARRVPRHPCRYIRIVGLLKGSDGEGCTIH